MQEKQRHETIFWFVSHVSWIENMITNFYKPGERGMSIVLDLSK